MRPPCCLWVCISLPNFCLDAYEITLLCFWLSPYFYVFHALCVVLKEHRRLVIPRIFVVYLWDNLALCLFVCPPITFLVFCGVRVVSCKLMKSLCCLCVCVLPLIFFCFLRCPSTPRSPKWSFLLRIFYNIFACTCFLTAYTIYPALFIPLTA
jgi:hypothetical protein